MERIIIRRMSEADLPQVHKIETGCFNAPWSINAFKYELEHKLTILKVAVLDLEIVGYVCIRTILDVTHVLNLAVLPGLRRRGISSALLQDALQELKRSGRETDFVTLEVRESNIAAIKLYEKFGFNIIGKMTGYYERPHEDAVIMGLEVGKNIR